MDLSVEISWINISRLPKDLELITITKTESLFVFDTEYDTLHETVTMGSPIRPSFANVILCLNDAS